jgi:hypothetical protein
LGQSQENLPASRPKLGRCHVCRTGAYLVYQLLSSCWFLQLFAVGDHAAFYNTSFGVWWTLMMSDPLFRSLLKEGTTKAALKAAAAAFRQRCIDRDPQSAVYWDFSVPSRWWGYVCLRCLLEPSIMMRFVWSRDGGPPVLCKHPNQVSWTVCLASLHLSTVIQLSPFHLVALEAYLGRPLTEVFFCTRCICSISDLPFCFQMDNITLKRTAYDVAQVVHQRS